MSREQNEEEKGKENTENTERGMTLCGIGRA